MKYVYLLKTGADYYKIGMAVNVRKRLSNIQTSNPEPVDLVCAVQVEDARRLEAYLHSTLDRSRATGGQEWFKLSPQQVVRLAVSMHKPIPLRTTSVLTATAEELESRAIEVFREHGRVSTFLLQRKLCIGYARAARIIDQLEERGLVRRQGPSLARILGEV